MPWKVVIDFPCFIFRILQMIFWFVFAASRMTYEIQAFMKEKELNPLKNLMVPLIQVSFSHVNLDFLLIDAFLFTQAPVFMSFFFALKGMANAPVESMQNGGLFWFSDLTICDPYYILPLLTSVTVWATMEVYYYCHFV